MGGVVVTQVTDMAHVEVRTPKTTNTEIILVETSYVKRIQSTRNIHSRFCLTLTAYLKPTPRFQNPSIVLFWVLYTDSVETKYFSPPIQQYPQRISPWRVVNMIVLIRVQSYPPEPCSTCWDFQELEGTQREGDQYHLRIMFCASGQLITTIR